MEENIGYFPLFIDLEGVASLVAGAGRVALRKAEALLCCGARLTVAAPEALPEFQALAEEGKLRLLRRTVRMEDVQGQRLVVAATGDQAVNRALAARCREAGVWVNVASDQQACTCKFPAMVRRGELTVGVSTGGASPTAALCVKERIEEMLSAGTNAGLEEALEYLTRTRGEVKERIKEEALRARVFAALFDRCMQRGGGLAEDELEALLEEAAR